MIFEHTPKVKELQKRLSAFFDEHIYPNEHRFEQEIEANREEGNAWVRTRVGDFLRVSMNLGHDAWGRLGQLWKCSFPGSPIWTSS
jgi:hypothetical protein